MFCLYTIMSIRSGRWPRSSIKKHPTSLQTKTRWGLPRNPGGCETTNTKKKLDNSQEEGFCKKLKNLISINVCIEKRKEFIESNNVKVSFESNILKYYLNIYLDHLTKEMFFFCAEKQATYAIFFRTVKRNNTTIIMIG